MPANDQKREQLHRERAELLAHLDQLTDKPMIVLAFVWLALLILDLTQGGLNPGLQTLSTAIWVLFVLDFLLSFAVAPNKLQYVRSNWLTVVSLLLPALRVLRLLRAFRALRLLRAVRSVNLLRLITSLNRSFRALGATLRRRGLPYVVALTAVLTFGGAAGMYFFEQPERAFRNYWDALWWTGMIITTMGSEYWPKTSEGRLLTWLLSVYAFAVFGYITAAIASYFVGRDQQERVEQGSPDEVTAQLLAEVTALRQELAALRDERARPAGEDKA